MQASEQKQNVAAQHAVGFMHMANGFKAFSSLFTPPSNNFQPKLNDDGTFNWNVGSLAITMEYYEELNVGWRNILNGIDGEFFYADWIYLEGDQALGGESGRITCFKKDVFLRWDSIKTKRQPGSRIASGIPGKPPPEPMSAIFFWPISM